MGKVCISQILVVDSYPPPHVIFTYFLSFMFLKYRKNIISVNQFTCDNHVFIEFHPTCFYVKDLRTRQLLLQGPSKLGLYRWPSFAASTSGSLAAFIGEKVSLDKWHLRLGHPSSPIVNQVVQSKKLPVSPSKSSSICSPCQ
jgi:hypothetical protein